MPSTDRTSELRSVVQEKLAVLPATKRRKLSRPSPRGRPDGSTEGQDALRKEFIGESYTILNHITALSRMLGSIRKPYLNVDMRAPPFSRGSPRTLDLSADASQLWSNIRYLTNEERDQIDLQARVMLSRCAGKVKELEELEKRRAAVAASKTNPLARLLPSRLLPHDSTTASADFIAAHHASVAWYLNRRLAEASETQKEMQEERMKRQMQRTKTLGSGATREALSTGLGEGGAGTEDAAGPARRFESGSDDSASDGWFGGVPGSLASSFAASLRGADRPPSSLAAMESESVEDLSDDELELSQSQILQFETENANMLREVQDTLQSVQQAETRLLEISALQTELVANLTRQTELTDQLYDDAIAATGAVEKGNVELHEAKKRAKDSRLFILIFLMGASLSLLFLHYY